LATPNKNPHGFPQSREIGFITGKVAQFSQNILICKKIQGNFFEEMETGIFVSNQTELICLAEMHDEFSSVVAGLVVILYVD
jgi:hypothetical protein